MTLTVAASGSGFTLSSAKTLTIASGETTSAGTVTVTAVSDTTDGPDKSVLVSATASGGGVSAPSSVTLTIADDDAAPTVALSVASTSIPENGGSTTVTATLSHPSSAATTVTVTAASGLYTVGSDTTVVIAAGSTSNATDSVTITAVNDDIDNVGNRSVTVTGTAINTQGVGAVTGAEPDLDGRRGDADGDIGAFVFIGVGVRWCFDGDGAFEPRVERCGNADGVGFWRRLHAFEREDADHRVGGDDERRDGDGLGGERHDGRA